MKILFIGENWHGSNATSCKDAFRLLGGDVYDIDEMQYFPRWKSNQMRVIRKLITPLLVKDFRKCVRLTAHQYRPDLVFIFKGVMIFQSELQYFHSLGAKNFIFYPDVDLEIHYRKFNNNIWNCLPQYDVIFTPKSYQISLLSARSKQRIEYLPYAYDPNVHFSVNLTDSEFKEYDCDVVFIGTWGKERSAMLEELVSSNFSYRLVIWGNLWEKLSPQSPLRQYVKFTPAYGMTQAKALAGSKIALAFLSPPDLHTARTFEIPAQGAFMLAERTKEQTQFFREDVEIACFSDVGELRQKIDYYLQYADERLRIAQAGYLRVTQGGHSYVDRMRRVLEVYREIKTAGG